RRRRQGAPLLVVAVRLADVPRDADAAEVRGARADAARGHLAVAQPREVIRIAGDTRHRDARVGDVRVARGLVVEPRLVRVLRGAEALLEALAEVVAGLRRVAGRARGLQPVEALRRVLRHEEAAVAVHERE